MMITSSKLPLKISPTTVRKTLQRAVRTPNQSERLQILAPVADAFAVMQPVRDVRREEGDVAIHQKAVADIDSELMRERDTGARTQIAQQMADQYSELYDAQIEQTINIGNAKESIAGGRSGQIRFSPGLHDQVNRRFDDFLAITPGLIRDGAPPEFRVPVLGGQPGLAPRQPADCQYNITVEKPGEPAAIAPAGLDPEFLFFLKTKGKVVLRRFDDWLDEKGLEDSGQNRRLYEEELATAQEEFERERFEDRYCKPQDMPASSTYRGYRLLQLSIPIGEDDFRACNSPTAIYEGPLGVPTPPELDYEELVSRYVRHLRARPTSRYELDNITASDLNAGHRKDIAPPNQLILDMFIAASQIALRHPTLANSIAGQPTTPLLVAWLRSNEAADIKAEILEVWKRLLPKTELSEPSPTPEEPDDRTPPPARPALDDPTAEERPRRGDKPAQHAK